MPVTVEMTEKEYYDILLVGKSSPEKTALGDKLLGPDSEVADSKIERITVQKVKLAFNKRIRVLEAADFGEVNKEMKMEQWNKEILKSIENVQGKYKVKIKRIVYFLPWRGPLEKAEAVMREELKLLHDFGGGEQIFECMVVAATKFQHQGFDLEETKEIFHDTLKMATNDGIECPPIVLIDSNDSPQTALNMIEKALVLNDDTVPTIKEPRASGDMVLTEQQVSLKFQGNGISNQV